MNSIIVLPRVWLALFGLLLSCSAWVSLHYFPDLWLTWLPGSLPYSLALGVFHVLLFLSVYGVIASLINATISELGSRHKHHPVWAPLLSLARSLKVAAFLILIKEASTALSIPMPWEALLQQCIQVVALATLGWCVFQLIQAGEALLMAHLPADSHDNKDTRRRYTHIAIIKRILILLLVIMTIASILMTFEKIRAAGTAILASAGVFATIVGFSARGLLEGIFKGVQLAISQPVRLEDTVTINGETGTVTSITLNHVVVTLNDRSQLIVPTSELLDKTFKNWTHSSDDLMGDLLFYLNYNMPISPVRKKFQEILEASEYWDRGVGEMIVNDIKNGSVELKMIVTADSGRQLSKLRNEILEKLLEYMQKHHTEGLPG